MESRSRVVRRWSFLDRRHISVLFQSPYSTQFTLGNRPANPAGIATTFFPT